MVSGTETTTGNDAGALDSGESNTPPIYQALLNEMDADARTAITGASAAQQPSEDESAVDPQHRSSVNARAGQGGARAAHPS